MKCPVPVEYAILKFGDHKYKMKNIRKIILIIAVSTIVVN